MCMYVNNFFEPYPTRASDLSGAFFIHIMMTDSILDPILQSLEEMRLHVGNTVRPSLYT